MSEQRDGQPSDRREAERARLQTLRAKQPLRDDSREPGVLLSDAISHYCDWFELISPFDEINLKPACYKLTIGDEYAISGKICPLPDRSGGNAIRIPPFAVAIIKTTETINMPPFLIGRWNIQVSRAYQGLVWVGGPQVDAGYVGHLFCPIYNLSDKEVVLYRGEAIAVIDFEKTTKFHEGKSKPYRGGQLPENILFEDYKPQILWSGLVGHAVKIDQFGDQIKSFQERADNFVLLTFTVMAVLFAALTIFVARPDSSSFWNLPLFLISGLAIILSMFAWLRTKAEAKYFGRPVQIILMLFMLLAIVLYFHNQRSQHSEIEELRKQMQELRSDYPSRPKAPTPGPGRATEQSGSATAPPVQKSP
jgi:deoxycytidine triphosphate deaminase/preprotein translocase subunit SecG